jgi:hypothetical protein
MKKKVKKTVADVLLKKWSRRLDWNKKGKVIRGSERLPKKIKFQLANQDKIKELQPYIDKVLKALGHSEALVTDESMVADFVNVFSGKSAVLKDLKKISKKLNFSVSSSDYIWQVAEKVKANERY